jgi:hypothetical protein
VVDILTEIQTKMIIKQVEIDASAKAKMEEFTRVRLGLAPGSPVTGKQVAATGAAMQKIGLGGPELGGALVSGMMGLVTAITSIAGILGMMIENSKIIAFVMNTVGKALGLLMDLILLPFLPIIVWVLIKLFQGIMAFGRLWKDASKWIDEKLIKPFAEWIDTYLVQPFFAWVEGAKKWIEDVKRAIWDTFDWWEKALENIPFWIDDNITKPFWNWVSSVPGWVDTHIVKPFWNIFDSVSKWIQTYIYEPFHKTMWQIWAWLDTYIIQPFWTMFKFITGWIDTYIKNPFFEFVDRVKGLLSSVITWLWEKWNALVGAVQGNASGAEYTTSPNVPWAAEGGTVDKTGLAVIHKGETITPAGGGVTVIINGTYQNDEDLYKKFVDKLRRDQWRQNV